MRVPTASPRAVTYWMGTEFVWKDESAPPHFSVGDGIILSNRGCPDRQRWRVLDIWVSYDSQGPFDVGTHVFLEPVSETADDLPRRLAPEYFRSSERTLT
jgi:hypothetical protein